MNIPHITSMSELVLSGKRVLIRADLNVPLSNGKVTSDTRIRASIPTLGRAASGGQCGGDVAFGSTQGRQF